jgi:hypothetical protein
LDVANVFKKALAPYGPPLAAEHIHSDTAPGLEEFRRVFHKYITRDGRVGVGRVYSDWVENFTFNALATSHLGYECIGVFVGIPLTIYNHFYCFLNDPAVLPMIGNPSQEDRDTAALTALRLGDLAPLPKVPDDSVRRDAAMHLAWNAVMFVFFHELAHIEACHLQLLSEFTGLTEYLELPAIPVSADEGHLRLLLELDADHLAAKHLSSVWQSMWGRGAFQALAPLGLGLSWSISLIMLFLIMDGVRPVHGPLGTSTHPSPVARLIHISTLSVNRRLPGFDDGEDTVMRGFQEVLQWWKREQLRISSGSHGITDEIHEELNGLRRELADKYYTRLTRYALERRKRLGLQVSE